MASCVSCYLRLFFAGGFRRPLHPCGRFDRQRNWSLVCCCGWCFDSCMAKLHPLPSFLTAKGFVLPCDLPPGGRTSPGTPSRRDKSSPQLCRGKRNSRRNGNKRREVWRAGPSIKGDSPFPKKRKENETPAGRRANGGRYGGQSPPSRATARPIKASEAAATPAEPEFFFAYFLFS